MSTTNPMPDDIPRVASKQSVDKALEMLRTRAKKRTKRKTDIDEQKQTSIENYCIASRLENFRRKVNVSSGFSHNYAVLEMRNALSNSDWSAMQEMFPLLLNCQFCESIAWRYAFLIYLCSPASDQFQFQEFIEMCIGTEPIEDGNLLEKLMAIQNTSEK